MKKIVLTLASLSLMFGLVGATAASAAQTTKAPPAVRASTRDAGLSELATTLAKFHVNRNTRLSVNELKALGLKSLSSQESARVNKLAKSHGAKAATAGTYYWYTYHYYGHVWVDVYYSGPYYWYPYWHPYYVVYNNYKLCNYSGTGCLSTNLYTYTDYLDWYGNGSWYCYSPYSAYSSSSGGIPVYGYGPY